MQNDEKHAFDFGIAACVKKNAIFAVARTMGKKNLRNVNFKQNGQQKCKKSCRNTDKTIKKHAPEVNCIYERTTGEM